MGEVAFIWESSPLNWKAVCVADLGAKEMVEKVKVHFASYNPTTSYQYIINLTHSYGWTLDVHSAWMSAMLLRSSFRLRKADGCNELLMGLDQKARMRHLSNLVSINDYLKMPVRLGVESCFNMFQPDNALIQYYTPNLLQEGPSGSGVPAIFCFFRLES